MSVFNLQSSLPYINGNPRHERPIWIWDRDTAGFVWANGEGVKFWAASSLESLQATAFDKSHPAWCKVCQILDGLSPGGLQSDQAIGVNLYFPHMNGGAQTQNGMLAFQTSSSSRDLIKSGSLNVSGSLEQSSAAFRKAETEAELLIDNTSSGLKNTKTNSRSNNKTMSKSAEGHFVTLCRRSKLNNRTALIVEVIAVSDKTTSEKSVLNEAALDRAEVNRAELNITEPREKSSFSDELPKPETLTALPTQAPSLPKAPSLPEVTIDDIATELAGQEREGHELEGRELDIKDLIPQAQLEELARLITEADGRSEDVFNGKPISLAPSSSMASEQKTKTPKSADKRSLATSSSSLQESWSPLEIDLTTLAGVGNQEDLDQLFEAAQAPYALVSLQKIIHANSSFVSEFGYDDQEPLINDGADWLFPKSREVFSTLMSGEIGVSLTGSSLGLELVRLRSGRKLSRDVLITPVRLTRFNRTLLLLQLANDFDRGDNSETLEIDTTVPSSQLGQTFDTNSNKTTIPLLSAVSHEVRTPLNVILGFSEVMALEQFGPLGNEKYKDYVQDIHNSAQHALSLINDLLDLTKLKAGKWDVEPVEVDINTVVRQQVRLMRELAAQRHVRLRSDLEENLPQVHVDERSLQQILLNLISNAIKYDREGGLITVQTQLQDETTLLVSVSDTGPGMSEDEIKHAMEPFHQVLNEHASSSAVNPAFIGKKAGKSGTGLGLPISKALAEANDVGFSIESKKPLTADKLSLKNEEEVSSSTGTKVTLSFKVSASF